MKLIRSAMRGAPREAGLMGAVDDTGPLARALAGRRRGRQAADADMKLAYAFVAISCRARLRC